MEVSKLLKSCQFGDSDEIIVANVHVIRGKECSVKSDVCGRREFVFGGVVRGHVYDGVDVCLIHYNIQYIVPQMLDLKAYEGNAREVPEDNHEAPPALKVSK